jgi:Zn-dependent protease with chaperone function
MTIPYALRLVCACLAAFAALSAGIGLLVSLLAPAAIRIAEKMRAESAARFVLGLRLLPTGMAVLVVAGLCVPSYVRFEQRVEVEEVGIVCLGLATLALAFWAWSFVRAVRALAGSLGYLRQCDQKRCPAVLAENDAAVWVVEGSKPLLALAGLMRPRLVVSQSVMNALSPEQLAVAFGHERAHARSRDNLKRLLVILAPGIIPGFGMLERAWARFAEWAADDRAVAGDPQRSLSLAAALVRVARMGTGQRPPALLNAFLADAGDLEARVERLLKAPGGRSGALREWHVVLAAQVLVAGSIAAAMFRPAALAFVHGLLERLMH